MKNFFLFIASFLIISNSVKAQNCSYTTNEIDPITKRINKITKSKSLTGKFKLNQNILVAIGAKTDINILLLGLTIQSKIEIQDFKANKGYKAYLIFEDNSNLEIESIMDSKGNKFSQMNLGNYQYGIDLQYQITNENWLKIANKEIKMVRIEVDLNGAKTYRDTEINKSSKLDISDLLKCVF